MRRLVCLIFVLTAIVGFSAVVAQQIHIDNCCFVDRHCQTDQQWRAGWHAFQNGQCAAPAQSQTQTAAQPPPNTGATNIDNCCFVDRQCQTDQQWRAGWHAFQNGQCAAPAQSQPSMGPVAGVTEPLLIGLPPTTQISNCCNLDRECHTEEDWAAGWSAYKNDECAWELVKYKPPGSQPLLGIDNCCNAPGWFCLSDQNFRKGFMAYQANNHCPTHLVSRFMGYELHPVTENCCDLPGRDCQTDADWQRGYSDFLHFRCEIDVPLIQHSPIRIEGNRDFVASWKASLSLLKAQAPRSYDYAITGLHAIREHPDVDGDPTQTTCIAACEDGKTAYCESPTTEIYISRVFIMFQAQVIVHEACHCQRDEKGYDHDKTPGWETELPCYKAEADLMKELDPGNSLGLPWENWRNLARQHNVTDLRY